MPDSDLGGDLSCCLSATEDKAPHCFYDDDFGRPAPPNHVRSLLGARLSGYEDTAPITANWWVLT